MISRNQNDNNNIDLLEKFRETETGELPEFDNYDKPLEMGLWVLWVAKEKLNTKKLKAQQIVDVLLEIKEISVGCRAIVNAFNRAGGKLHKYLDEDETYYAIMKAGKDHLIKLAGEGSVRVYYFESGKKHHSKSILANNILAGLEGEIKIVDPYCSERTLDILGNSEVNNLRFLTHIENLSEQKKNKLLRELQDFKSEHSGIQFRNYPKTDIHDRYVISSEFVVILGHSLKDLGSKESFAIVLNKETNINVFGALTELFNRRWKSATPL